MPDRGALRIGIDARELLAAPTGVGRYLSELLRRWACRADRTSRALVLYAPASRRASARALLETYPPGALEVREVAGAGGTRWEQVQLPRAARADSLDVFFAPAYTAPIRLAVPIVVAIHDISYLAHPEWFDWRSSLRRRWLGKASAARAALVLTGTEFSRREIGEHLSVRPESVEVVPYGITAPPVPDPQRPRELLVLFAGSIFNRRHVPDLIRAFARVAVVLPDARLVVAGENRTFPFEDPAALAAQLGVDQAVQFRSYVSDEDLTALYGRARVFAFLSEYEGFGMTPLEALSAGVPSVVYDTAIAREAYGDAAVFVPAGDVHRVSEALTRLLLDREARQRILDRAPAVLARYSWDRCAEATLAALERTARPG